MKISKTFSIERKILGDVMEHCEENDFDLNRFAEAALEEKLKREKKA